MKVAVVFFALVAVVLAAPQSPDKDAEVVRFESDNIGVDGYNYNVETSNGISMQERGILAKVGEDDVIQVQGQYSYKDAEGKTYSVSYIADETGFHPEGEHLPH